MNTQIRKSTVGLASRKLVPVGVIAAALGSAWALPPSPPSSLPPAPQRAYPAAAAIPQHLTLAEAQNIAITNHPRVKAAEFVALATRQNVREQRSAYLPHAYGSLSGVEALKNTRVAAGGLNNPVIYPRYANGVTVSQLITNFGRTSNLVQSARLGARAQASDTAAVRNQVLLNVTRAYFNVLRANAVLRVARQAVGERKTVVDQVQALAKSKLKSGLDVSFANVNLSQAQLLLVQAQDGVQASYAQLAETMGVTLPASGAVNAAPPVVLQDTALPAAPSSDMQSLLQTAFRERPDIQAARFVAQADLKYANAERDLRYPTISALGTAGLAPWRVANLPSHYAAAGVNVNIPIFNGFLFSARHAKATLRAEAAQQHLLDVQNLVTRDVRVAWLQTRTAYQRLSLTAQLLKQARLGLDLAQARYKIGLGSIVELSQAQLNSTQAEIDNAEARYDYQIQAAYLNYELGLHP